MDELSLKTEVSLIEQQANGIDVFDEDSFKNAAEFLRNIKRAAGKITEFFEPLKTAAHNSHKAICAKENEFKKPIDNAEKIVKGKATAYQMEQDRIRREKERELLRIQQEEARRIAEEAARLEKEGKPEEAELVFEKAIKEEQKTICVMPTPKADGISFKVDYDVVIESESNVPAYIRGICIRPVDLSAIKRLVVQTSGKIEIPGIKITETRNMSVRK